MDHTISRHAAEELDFRLKILLPEQYLERYSDVEPVSMGSAGLKYDTEGKVVWGEMWQTFCDLAMAGGPPHKGALLEQGRPNDVDAAPERYDAVAAETCRGIALATDLYATADAAPGWLRVDCFSETMAAWLLRAVVMENVAVRLDGRAIYLPASPHFRLEKEIKNVVTVIAKTCHYWMGHVPREQKRAIADLFASLAERMPLVEPELVDDGVIPKAQVMLAEKMADTIHRDTGLPRSNAQYAGWLGVECARVRDAVWMMRALVASNVLARREGTTLFVPVNPRQDPEGNKVSRSVVLVHGLATLFLVRSAV